MRGHEDVVGNLGAMAALQGCASGVGSRCYGSNELELTLGPKWKSRGAQHRPLERPKIGQEAPKMEKLSPLAAS